MTPNLTDWHDSPGICDAQSPTTKIKQKKKIRFDKSTLLFEKADSHFQKKTKVNGCADSKAVSFGKRKIRLKMLCLLFSKDHMLSTVWMSNFYFQVHGFQSFGIHQNSCIMRGCLFIKQAKFESFPFVTCSSTVQTFLYKSSNICKFK